MRGSGSPVRERYRQYRDSNDPCVVKAGISLGSTGGGRVSTDTQGIGGDSGIWVSRVGHLPRTAMCQLVLEKWWVGSKDKVGQCRGMEDLQD